MFSYLLVWFCALFTTFQEKEVSPSMRQNAMSCITAHNEEFSLNTPNLSYRFHIHPETREVIHDHYGGPTTEISPSVDTEISEHEVLLGRQAREFPDLGRGDFRIPAIHIKHSAGHTVSNFLFSGYKIIRGKPELPGLPSTWAKAGKGEVETLIVYMEDSIHGLTAELRYSVFPGEDAIARSTIISNHGGKGDVEILKAASWSTDLRCGEDLEMIYNVGDWSRESRTIRRKVEVGIQGFQSSAGYSSHFHNPFVALVTSETTETTGAAYGFNLIYTGSHSTEIEKYQQGYSRVIMGLNPIQLNWTLKAGESFATPECVSVYSDQGLGGMSRAFHRLYRNHLSISPWTNKTRPTLLNNWEATYFDFDGDSLLPIATKAAELGVKLFVMDDGWFGNKHPRTSDHQGLGDWDVNKSRFPNGLKPFVKSVNSLKPTGGKENMSFGIWVEPEMVNSQSELYELHPDWCLHASGLPRTTQRYQLVLNVGLPQVQEYIINKISNLLESSNITYVKWDNNRMMHEMSSPSSAHQYILGLYHVLDTLTTRFPNVLWEGCASGGGRFDAGILRYFPQTWTSDNTDALDRIGIQWGTSLAYPPSSMGCHVSAVPNHQTYRTTPLEFRAHVAMMGGSFGFELDPTKLSKSEQESIPYLISLAEKINPMVINGDLYRLADGQGSNWPAAMFLSEKKDEGVIFAFQKQHRVKLPPPTIRLQGLDPESTYKITFAKRILEDSVGDGPNQEKLIKAIEEEANKVVKYSGKTLMSTGMKLLWRADYQSRIMFIQKV